MVNSVLQNDIKKSLEKTTIKTELSPGSPRRYDPPEGVSKLNKRIHAETAYADKYKNLPFEFSKPKKAKRTIIKYCSSCGNEVSVATNCVGIICRSCGQYSKVIEVPKYEE